MEPWMEPFARTIDSAKKYVVSSTLDRVDAVQASAWTDPRHLRLTVAGPMAPVLRAIAPLDPVDLLARPADLDELFLGYYRSTDLQEA